jgi:hypothetical protein
MANQHGHQIVACTTIFVVLTAASTALRFYVRLVIKKNFGLDDWLLLVTLVCSFLTRNECID